MQIRRTRGQVATEFLILAAFFLLVFTVVLAYFSSLQGREIEDREYALGREVAALVADRVHSAVVAGAGYQSQFSLPQAVAGQYPYELRITNKSVFSAAYVEVNWTKGGRQFEYSIPLASRNICTGNPAKNPPRCVQPIYNSYTLKITDFSKQVKINNTGVGINVWQE